MVTWPNKIVCPIVISFDLDGISGTINRNPASKNLPTLMSMREYGPSIATPRILDLLDSHKIKSSFFIPGFIAETHPELVLDIHRRGHEIGNHGYMHEPPATLTPQEEEHVLLQGSEILKDITGQSPVGYRSPSWELSPDSLEILKRNHFLYDSSMMGNDVPYLIHTREAPMIEIPIHWELDDHPFFNYIPFLNQTNVMASPQHVYSVWSAAFEGLYTYKRTFVLTMHPWIIGRPGRLNMLDKLITMIKSFQGTSFMACKDLAVLKEHDYM